VQSVPQEEDRPTILVPYEGPADGHEAEDIFIYLRPETNGVEVESRLLRVMKQCPAYRNGLDLVYMANLPGEYMLNRHVVEQHYRHKLYFAVHGKQAFTPWMRTSFESQTGESFDAAHILGAFEALREFQVEPEGLFARWVDESLIRVIAGQTVKYLEDAWVVASDIPALLHKNSRGTDIAVMLFRSRVGYSYFEELVQEMYEQIIDAGLVNPRLPLGRIFHYSRSPFEQLLDGMGYLVDSDGSPHPVEDLSFVRYCRDSGLGVESLLGIVRNPLFGWVNQQGIYFEDDVFRMTEHATYRSALEKLDTAVTQILLRAPASVDVPER